MNREEERWKPRLGAVSSLFYTVRMQFPRILQEGVGKMQQILHFLQEFFSELQKELWKIKK